MCYINGVRVSLATYIEYKRIQKELKALNEILLHQPARRGFDYSEWPVIKPAVNGSDWDLVAMEWGFLPNHLKDSEGVKRFRYGYKDDSGKFHTPYTTLNAIGEEMLDAGKMYRTAAKQNRCIIISSGFYEHRHVIVMGKKGKPLKTPEKFPYYITVKDAPYFFMAGIYNTWTDQTTGETKDTFAIVTTEANSLMAQVHNAKKRMPVILPQELAEEWTNPDLTEERIKEIGTYQFPAEQMIAYPVSKDFIQCDEPTTRAEYEQLPDLVLN